MQKGQSFNLTELGVHPSGNPAPKKVRPAPEESQSDRDQATKNRGPLPLGQRSSSSVGSSIAPLRSEQHREPDADRCQTDRLWQRLARMLMQVPDFGLGQGTVVKLGIVDKAAKLVGVDSPPLCRHCPQ